ncbi:MAG: YfbM family protein [Myxococcota bacterium]
MAYRGVHFALSDDDVSRLLAIASSEELEEFITEEIEETYFEESREWVYETDHAWDAIHRCLGDGTLLYGTGPFPLSYAVLGGAALDAGEDYTACLTTPEQVAEVAEALRRTDASWFRSRFDSLSRTNTEFSAKGDFDYVWSNLDGLREFLARAAKAKRHVLFTVDA